MRCLINHARRSRGLRPLRANASLGRAARLKARAILHCQDFRHNACGQSWSAVFRHAGYTRGSEPFAIAENLAFAPRSWCSPRATLRLWLLSRVHRANIFARAWRDGGDALVRGRLNGERVAIWASEFGRRD